MAHEQHELIFEDMEQVRKEALRAAGSGQRSMAAILRLGENAKPVPDAGAEGDSRTGMKLVSRRKAAE